MLNGESAFELMKFYLVGTIVWYEQNYGGATKEYCDELIERVKSANSIEELECVGKMLDSWLDS